MAKSIMDITIGSGYEVFKEDDHFLEDSSNLTLSFFTMGAFI